MVLCFGVNQQEPVAVQVNGSHEVVVLGLRQFDAVEALDGYGVGFNLERVQLGTGVADVQQVSVFEIDEPGVFVAVLELANVDGVVLLDDQHLRHQINEDGLPVVHQQLHHLEEVGLQLIDVHDGTHPKLAVVVAEQALVEREHPLLAVELRGPVEEYEAALVGELRYAQHLQSRLGFVVLQLLLRSYLVVLHVHHVHELLVVQVRSGLV